MKTGLHQHAALRQDLRINPRLYQAMDLLYMPLLDLEQHLKQELLGNPFLEMIEPEEEVQATAAEQQQNKPEKEAKAEDGPDWENILLEDRTEHPCQVVDMSPGNVALRTERVGMPGCRTWTHGDRGYADTA